MKRSYVVWHTQRTGSTLLCTALEQTGVAGRLGEWPHDLESQFDAGHATPTTFLEQLKLAQTTPNGVTALKFGYHDPTVKHLFDTYSDGRNRKATWEALFPNCQHIFTTRCDKLRLAVSWWKSICGGASHLSHDGSPLPWQDSMPQEPANLVDMYDYTAISNLMVECEEREAGLKKLFLELQVEPLTIVYEDFIQNYEATIQNVLDFLDLSADVEHIPEPSLRPTSNEINETWIARYNSEDKPR